jgi:nitrogen fixation NifU-like protein
VYSPELLDHFEHPRNAGIIELPDASVQLENPACGDVLKLSARFVDGHIAEIKFLAKGCVPAMACGSAITELAKGKTLAEASAVKREQLVNTIGALQPASTHASHLAIDALTALIKQLQR